MSSSIYVADEKGRLFIGAASNKCIHHSHILTSNPADIAFGFGKDVSSAGHIDLVKGKITRINNGSGHYLPSSEQFFIFVKHLSSLGLLDPEAKIEYYDTSLNSFKEILLSEIDKVFSRIDMAKYALEPLPSFRELLNMMSHEIKNNHTLDFPEQIGMPIIPQEGYEFKGKRVREVLPNFPSTTRELPTPINLLGKIEFSLDEHPWEGEAIVGCFVRDDLISKLLSVTLYSDNILQYEYLIASSEESSGGILSMRTKLPINKVFSLPMEALSNSRSISLPFQRDSEIKASEQGEHISSSLLDLIKEAYPLFSKGTNAVNGQICIINE